MEEFVLAIALGGVGGIIGFAPFLVARSRIKARLKSDGTGSIVMGLAAVFISFFIMILEIVLCRLLVQEYFLPFCFSAIVVFLLAVGVYVATLMRR